MIHKCSCPECIAASLQNIDALEVYLLRLATAAAEARRLLGEGDQASARDVIDAATIKAADLAADMVAYARLVYEGPAESTISIIDRPAPGRLH